MDTLLTERPERHDPTDNAEWAMPAVALRASASCGERALASIDRAHLARYTLGDAALEREVLALFVAQLPSYLADLAGAADERAFAMAAHTIKGSARAVGAARLAAAARAAELSRGDDPATRRVLVDAVTAAFADAAHFVEGIMADAGK